MDNRQVIQERLANIGLPFYSGIIFRSCVGTETPNTASISDVSFFGSNIIRSRGEGKDLTYDDIIDSINRVSAGLVSLAKEDAKPYEAVILHQYREGQAKVLDVKTYEAVVLLQYRNSTGLVLKYIYRDDGSEELFIIGELQPHSGDFRLMI